MAKITKAFIDRVKAPETEYDNQWDESVRGYGVRVTSGGKKVFFVQGRVRGKAVQFTLGPYGVLTEDAARKKAQSVLQQMREGIDPRDAQKEDAAAKVTLREVANAYLYERPGMLREATVVEKNRHIETVFGAWKDKPIASITEADVRKRYTEMATKGLRGTPAPGQAQIAMTTLSVLINFAMRRYKRADGTPLIAHNPVAAMKGDWPGFKPRTRDIDEKHVGATWNLLTEMRAHPKNQDALAGIDLVRFLMLTGCRRSEAASLEWRTVNLDEAWFHLANTKNGNPVWLPLSSLAVALLKARKPKDDDKDASLYCFPSRAKGGFVTDTRAPLERIAKLIDQPISAHDLRRTFVSTGVATLGIDLYKMELLTNHVPQGVTAKHYLRTQRLQYLLPEAQLISDWIEQQAAKASGANVVALRA
ncbi:site-specific integrase [Sphingobium sufflavum]|uniref:tyrosine-type recombinase/integrase n=1 Tax=Sphingobium sufflavum TaxID=1129547 RepID=UPI001F2EA1B3|nr:site-specific integrase [Sphingobium sufflavum]MCE7798430.1 site-specific integrase [Sphingobium sufflavum]